MIRPRAFEIAQRFVRLSARAQQRERWIHRKMLSGIQRAREMSERFSYGVQRLRLLARALRILKCLLPRARFEEVMGQLGQVRLQRRCIKLFDGLGDLPVQRLALARQQIAIHRFVAYWKGVDSRLALEVRRSQPSSVMRI